MQLGLKVQGKWGKRRRGRDVRWPVLTEEGKVDQ